MGGASVFGGATSGGGVSSSRPPVEGQIPIEECRGKGGVDELCTLITNATACVDKKCSNLVVVFSGGEMGCATQAGYKTVLDGYASRGYAAVCINYFETGDGSGVAPYVDEATRIDIAVRAATTGGWAQSYWTGENLLFEGISHGATAPVILMARTTLDEQSHWHGRLKTGGCFFDGSYDQAATASLLASGAAGGKPCTFPVPHQRWLERYCGGGASTAACDLTKVPKAVDDTITKVSSKNFSIRDFRMFECGSALAACSGDIIPGDPIQTLCSSLDDAQGMTCSYTSLASQGHLTCHSNEFDSCRTWFEGLAQR